MIITANVPRRLMDLLLVWLLEIKLLKEPAGMVFYFLLRLPNHILTSLFNRFLEDYLKSLPLL